MSNDEEKIYIPLELIDCLTCIRVMIQKLDMDNVELTENGKLIKISKKAKEHFYMSGLSNMDFFTSNMFREK